MLKTKRSAGSAPGSVRIMAGQKLSFAPGDQIEVLGSKIKRMEEWRDCREISRGGETSSFVIGRHASVGAITAKEAAFSGMNR